MLERCAYFRRDLLCDVIWFIVVVCAVACDVVCLRGLFFVKVFACVVCDLLCNVVRLLNVCVLLWLSVFVCFQKSVCASTNECFCFVCDVRFVVCACACCVCLS